MKLAKFVAVPITLGALMLATSCVTPPPAHPGPPPGPAAGPDDGRMEPPPPAPVPPADPAPPADPSPPPPPPPPPPDPGTALAADGARCSAGSDCQSGTCEGQGCGAGSGICVSKNRRCTMDLRQYCGCDNKTFSGSGSCPGRLYAHRGACKTAKLAGGASCSASDQCLSGVCEGPGCGQGKCAPIKRRCTRDRRPYCGCDGKTFYSSGRCPGQVYAYAGACKTSKRAAGSACATGAQCQSGTCEGQGCGAAETGKCVANNRMCTKDYRAYCGCDGKTFHGSGSCPGRRYRHGGECKVLRKGGTPTPAPSKTR